LPLSVDSPRRGVRIVARGTRFLRTPGLDDIQQAHPGGVSRISRTLARSPLPLTLQRPKVIHNVPHIRVANTGLTIESLHCAPDADSVANINKDFTVGRPVVPLVIGQV